MRLTSALFASAIFWLWSEPAAAVDEEPICVDRPGIGTPTCTVPAGMLQLETSIIDWTGDRVGRVRNSELSIGDTAVKFGVTDRFHLELDITPSVRIRTREGAVREGGSGFGDFVLAAKYRLTRDSAPVQIAVLPFVKVPTAKRSVGNGKVEGGVIVPIEYEIPGSQLSLGLSPQFDVNADSDGTGHHLATALVISLAIPLTGRLSASAELLGYWDFDPSDTGRQSAIGGSTAYLISKNVQLDAGANLGLNRNTPDIQLYSGIAFRL